MQGWPSASEDDRLERIRYYETKKLFSHFRNGNQMRLPNGLCDRADAKRKES